MKLKATPPRIYNRLRAAILNPLLDEASLLKTKTSGSNADSNSSSALKANVVGESGTPSASDAAKTSKWGKGLMTRLLEQGDSRIFRLKSDHLHIEYTRFMQPLGEIKGLDLQSAIQQLKWQQKPICKLLEKELIQHALDLEQAGFDLDKTFVAHAYCSNRSNLQQRFLKMCKGRGRYGSTPHPLTSQIEWIFQQREQGFKKRLQDPLEHIRQQLRSKIPVNISQMVQEAKKSRIELEIKNI